MNIADWLTVSGGLFEVLGLVIVGFEIGRLQQREFGKIPFLDKPLRWLGRVVDRVLGRNATVVAKSAFDFAIAEDAARLSIRKRATTQHLADRVKALEDNLVYVHDDLLGKIEDAEKHTDHVASSVTALRRDLDLQDQQREADRRENLRETITLQWFGTGMFVFGAILSVLGGVL